MNADSYRTWLERTLSGRDSRALDPGDVVKSSSGEPFAPISFVKTKRDKYTAEVGWKGPDLIYHFYTDTSGKWPVGTNGETFEDAMGDAFLQVFKFPERLEQAFTEELNSWAVRVRGLSGNLVADELIEYLLNVLDNKLVSIS